MKSIHLGLAMFSVALLGCGGGKSPAGEPAVSVEILNQSSHLLENALARFGTNECKWGYVAMNGDKGYGFYPHPITDDAELHWDEGGKHQVMKLDLRKIYAAGKSGALTFTVHDGRAEASFKEGNP